MKQPNKRALRLKKKTVMAFKTEQNALKPTTIIEYCTLSIQTFESCVTKKRN